jgi:eukaryotic-like serine/threonine-protein kinase
LPRFIYIFAQVCQTLAYAHAHGVIHRDLKPSNIMVGNYGEVQVMDWGLAKVLPQGGVADEKVSSEHLRPEEDSVVCTQRSAGPSTLEADSNTHPGTLLGTPAYMAPEQARGELNLVDARADVFGLGAILCEILTGRPPFKGPNAEAVKQAQTAQLDDAFARMEGSGADGELIGLAKSCLAIVPWDRPRDAGAVTEAVTAYQISVTERLRESELAQATEAARTKEAVTTAAHERRARRLTLWLAASVVALVTVGAAGGTWAQRQWAAQSAEALRKREAVDSFLDKARDWGRQGRWAEARAELDQARDRLGEAAPEDLRKRVEQATADLALVDRLETIRLKRLTLILTEINAFDVNHGASPIVRRQLDYRGAAQEYAAAFQDAGLGAEGDDAETVAARIRESAVAEQLVAALDDWAVVMESAHMLSPTAERIWMLEAARRADPDPWRDRFRDFKMWHSPPALKALATELLQDEKLLAKQKPQLLAALGFALRTNEVDPTLLLAAARECYPGDFWLNFDLAEALCRAKKWDEAAGFYRVAITIRPSVMLVHNNLGDVLLVGTKHFDEAIHEYRRAIELDPKFAMPHSGLGSALRNKNQLDEAIEEYRRAIELDKHFASPHNGLGLALSAKKQPKAAIQEFHRAIKLDPGNAVFQDNLKRAQTDAGVGR